MKLLFLFLIYVVVCIFAYFSLSDLDKTVLTSAYSFYKLSECASTSIFSFYFLFKLLLPFRILVDEHAFAKVTAGALYNFHLVPYELALSTEDKLYMHNVFVENNLNTPTLYAYSNEKEVIMVENFDEKETYILKPRYGCFGNDIEMIKGHEIHDHLKKKKHFLVQQFLKDCTNDNNARHYRVVTMYNGDIFAILQLSQKDSTKIASNMVKGSTNTNDPIPQEIHELSERAASFHKENYKVMSIGWDIMLDCNGFKKAYILELNVGHSILRETSSTDEIVRYKKYATDFYRTFQR
jgi:glutathione synthase/RimK-type ligase-like ATP-grasp enzyme